MGAAAAEVLSRDGWDVVVVGGGPAGLTAARDLASQGYSILVAEEHTAVGCPVHCTGLIGTDAFDELSLPRGAIRTIIRQARFRGPSGKPVLIETQHVAAAVIDRGEFDAALAAEASKAGAQLMLGRRAERIDVDAGGVCVQLRGLASPVRARACVLACGANYRFNRMVGLGVPPMLLQSAQAEVVFPAAECIDVFFGRQLAPCGFAWLVPVPRDGRHYARIGLLCTAGAGERFRAFAEHIWSEWRIALPPPQPRLKALPLGPIDRTYTNRVLAVGDAAGLVKPTTGGGIYYSLLSASLAAGVLTTALRRDTLHDRALAEYERAWRHRLGGDIRAGLAFRRIAGSLSDEKIDRLLGLARVDGIVPLLKMHANFNWHRAAAVALLRYGPFRRTVASFWS